MTSDGRVLNEICWWQYWSQTPLTNHEFHMIKMRTQLWTPSVEIIWKDTILYCILVTFLFLYSFSDKTITEIRVGGRPMLLMRGRIALDQFMWMFWSFSGNLDHNRPVWCEGWGLSHRNYFFFFGRIDRSWRNVEIYK